MYDLRLDDPYWNLTRSARERLSKERRNRFFFEHLYSERRLGDLDSAAWGAFFRNIGDDISIGLMDVGEFFSTRTVNPNSAIQGGLVGGLVGGIVGGFMSAGVVGAAVGAGVGAVGFLLGAGIKQDKFALTREDYEVIGLNRMIPRRRIVDTYAAKTMRQATLSAMHNSVYSLRGAIGNEASLMHG